MIRTRAAIVFLLSLVTLAVIAADTAASVNDVMINVITPATNTIWGIEDPQSDEEWQVYIDAAAELVAAAETIKAGGSGPNDAEWAAATEWQQFADELIESGREVRAAARARDLDTLVDVSNEKMYPPCEECHLRFHPGVAQ